MTAKSTMPHTTVGLAPSGEYVVLVEGDPVPDWFVLDDKDDDAKPETSGTRRRTQKSE